MDLNPSSIFDNIDFNSPVSDIKKEADTKLADLKGSVLNPISSSTARIKDGIALLNNMDTKFNQAVTGFKSDVMGVANSIIGTLQDGYFTINELVSMVIGAYTSLTNLSNIGDDLKSILGTNVSNIDGFLDRFSNIFVSSINSKVRASGYKSNTVSSGGEFLTITQSNNNPSSQAIIAALGKLSVGDLQDSYDSSVSTAVYSTLLSQAVSSGLTSSYADLYNKITDKTEADKAVVSAIGNALANGDLTSIVNLLALITNGGTKLTIGSTYPNAAETLLSKYKPLDSQDVSDYPAISEQLKTILVLFGGVNWWKVYTSLGWVPNLLIASKLSSSVRDIWMEDAELFALVACKGFFKEMTARKAFLTNFPQTPIS